MSTNWPQWINPTDEVNLRAVAPQLFVGGRYSAQYRTSPWGVIVDLFGTSLSPKGPGGTSAYSSATTVLAWPFEDGETIPPFCLDTVVPLIKFSLLSGQPVLIHCQAGLSRSASVAYAALRSLHGLSHRDALSRVSVPGYQGVFPRAGTLASARAWIHRRRAAQPETGGPRILAPPPQHR